MKLLINNASTFKGGSEQVALSFIHECKKFSGHEYFVIIGENLAKQIDIGSFPQNFSFYTLARRPASSPFTYIKTMRWLNKLEKEIQPNCVIATGGHGYWRPKVPLVAGFNMPHYLYPDSPYFSKISFRKRIYWNTRKFVDLFFFNRVDAYLVQTEDVNERVKKLIGSKNVFTIPNTVNGSFLDYKVYPDRLPKREKGEIRLLTLSSYYPHKNLEIINDVALKLLQLGVTNIKFVLTLPDDIFQNKFNAKAKVCIYNLGPIPTAECPSLYDEIDFMFLPTLLECFSASYAEAMVMEKPILTSDLSFARTVCKEAAIYFDPLDPGDIANKIINLINNKKTQNELIAKGKELLKNINTPSERAEAYLSICQKISRKNE